MEAFRVIPFGRDPETSDHEYVPVPPEAASVCVYGELTALLCRDVVVIVRGAGVTLRVRLTVAVCAGEAESVTLKVKGVALTTAVGVPPISPEDAVSDNPAGSVPAVNCHV